MEKSPTSSSTLTREELKLQIKKMLIFISISKDITIEQLKDDDYIINKDGMLGLDSLDAMEVAVTLEKNYLVDFSGVAKAKKALRSIDTLCDYIINEGDISIKSSFQQPPISAQVNEPPAKMS